MAVASPLVDSDRLIEPELTMYGIKNQRSSSAEKIKLCIFRLFFFLIMAKH
jgi:hypothetical protein